MQESLPDSLREKFIRKGVQSDPVKLMLDIGPANKILPNGFSMWSAPIYGVVNCFHSERLRQLHLQTLSYMESQMMNVDGQTRKDAIKMKGEGVREEKQKKGGILGLFSQEDK